MHEMGIAMQVAEIATSSIPEDLKGVKKVERVNLRVGKLSSVIPESLRFCFEVVVKDTPLDGAELVMEEVPVVTTCKECHEQWTLDTPSFACKKCGSGSIEVISGRELDITSIELED